MEILGTTAGRGRTILAVDANHTNLGVIGRRLAHFDYITALSDDGAQALGMLAGGGFDLVLLDMALPRISGLRILEEIRASTDMADLPVIMMTGRSDPGAAVQALAAGADDHVAKPFDFEILAARIERVLTRSRRLVALKHANEALGASNATRSSELDDVKNALEETRAERRRLISSIQALNDQMELLGAVH